MGAWTKAPTLIYIVYFCSICIFYEIAKARVKAVGVVLVWRLAWRFHVLLENKIVHHTTPCFDPKNIPGTEPRSKATWKAGQA